VDTVTVCEAAGLATGEVADLIGCGKQSIYYLLRQGTIPQPPRGADGERV